MSLADDLSRLEQLHQRGSLDADEFQRAKARLLDGAIPASPVLQSVNALRRSSTDRWIGGVCGGLATGTGMAAWLWRLVFALLLLVGGSGVLLYLVLWFFVPMEATVPLLRAPS